MADRKTISQNTEKLLWAMSAGRCEKCGRLVYRHPMSQVLGNFAQIAHNLPVSDFGPRSNFKKKHKQIDPNMDIDDVSNLLLLCYDCHKEIDKIHPSDFPPQRLRQIKNDFEEFVLKATNNERIIPTTVVTYSPNLHGQRITITKSQTQKAVSPDKVINCEFDITLKNSSYNVGDAKYWQYEESNLVRIFEEKITPRLEDYTLASNNFSVFAIGPIPLLIKLGTLLSNKNDIDVYQFKKSPTPTWEWESCERDFDYEIKCIQQKKDAKRIILMCSLSGVINQSAVQRVISWDDANIIEIRTTCQPHDDILRSKKQLDKFVLCYRQLKEQMLNMSNQRLPVHLFAAIPVSMAVEIGRHWNPTVDLPMVIYNLTNGQYEKAITIGGNNE